jgi:hypothetical protein
MSWRLLVVRCRTLRSRSNRHWRSDLDIGHHHSPTKMLRGSRKACSRQARQWQPEPKDARWGCAIAIAIVGRWSLLKAPLLKHKGSFQIRKQLHRTHSSDHVHSALTIICFYSSNTNPLRPFTASRTAFTPASPKLTFPRRESLVRTALTLSASAIAFVPSSPMLL